MSRTKQASNPAGMFADVVRFSLQCSHPEEGSQSLPDAIASTSNNPDNRDNDGEGDGNEGSPEWHEVGVPPDDSRRGREWRILVESCQAACAHEARWEGATDSGSKLAEGGENDVVNVPVGGIIGLEMELNEVRK